MMSCYDSIYKPSEEDQTMTFNNLLLFAIVCIVCLCQIPHYQLVTTCSADKYLMVIIDCSSDFLSSDLVLL